MAMHAAIASRDRIAFETNIAGASFDRWFRWTSVSSPSREPLPRRIRGTRGLAGRITKELQRSGRRLRHAIEVRRRDKPQSRIRNVFAIVHRMMIRGPSRRNAAAGGPSRGM